ncbi:MAG: hypothetical protein SGARI_001633 [Bacillariaceae sp.]
MNASFCDPSRTLTGRKTHIAIPGVPREEQKITGEITAGQWGEVMLELREQEMDSKSVMPYPSESVDEVEGFQDDKADEGNNQSSSSEGETQEGRQEKESPAVENEADGETELE